MKIYYNGRSSKLGKKTMSHKNLKIGIIGGTGWMGKIMGEAILQKKLISADQLWISNRSGRHSYSAPVHFTTNSQELIDAVDVVLIAVRPFQILQFKADIKDKLLISIMADSIESKVLAGRPLNMKEDSTLLYQDEGIVAAGTQGMERQVRNMRSIGLTEQEIKKITCTTAAKVLGVSRYVNYEIAA